MEHFKQEQLVDDWKKSSSNAAAAKIDDFCDQSISHDNTVNKTLFVIMSTFVVTKMVNGRFESE